MINFKYYNFLEKYNVVLDFQNYYYIKNKNLSKEDELLLIEKLKRGGYSLGYYHQKEIEKNLNKFRWVNSIYEGMLHRISENNMRIMYTTNDVIFYSKGNFKFDHQPDVVIGNYESCDDTNSNRSLDFYSIVINYHNLKALENKYIIRILKFLNIFNQNKYENLVEVYLESYKEGLLDYLKENDEKYKDMNWTFDECDVKREFGFVTDKSSFIKKLVI